MRYFIILFVFLSSTSIFSKDVKVGDIMVKEKYSNSENGDIWYYAKLQHTFKYKKQVEDIKNICEFTIPDKGLKLSPGNIDKCIYEFYVSDGPNTWGAQSSIDETCSEMQASAVDYRVRNRSCRFWSKYYDKKKYSELVKNGNKAKNLLVELGKKGMQIYISNNNLPPGQRKDEETLFQEKHLPLVKSYENKLCPVGYTLSGDGFDHDFSNKRLRFSVKSTFKFPESKFHCESNSKLACDKGYIKCVSS